MIHVLAEAARSINSVADANKMTGTGRYMNERGDKVVELDRFKSILSSYEEPLAGMRDSL